MFFLIDLSFYSNFLRYEISLTSPRKRTWGALFLTFCICLVDQMMYFNYNKIQTITDQVILQYFTFVKQIVLLLTTQSKSQQTSITAPFYGVLARARES